MLPFENRYLKRYHAWLLTRLRSDDPARRQHALDRLVRLVFPDEVMTRAIEKARNPCPRLVPTTGMDRSRVTGAFVIYGANRAT